MTATREDEFATRQTARLRLRVPTEADVPALVPRLDDMRVSDNLYSVPHPYTEDDARRYLDYVAAQRAAQTAYSFLAFAAEDGSGERLVGGCEVREINAIHRHAVLGVWVAVDDWGRGYATEMLGEMLAIAFAGLRLNRVQAYVRHDNLGSRRVMEKLCLSLEGIQREYLFLRGRFYDVGAWAILARDYETQPPTNSETR